MTAISEMSNAELDRLIADKRGWRPNQLNYGIYPSFTTDPRYAMELLEELCAKNKYVEIERDTYQGNGYVICGSLMTEYCPTLKRAICEKWVEENATMEGE